MSERLLLDTHVLVEYLRGQPKAVEYVEKIEADLLISTISVAELFAGARDPTGQAWLTHLSPPPHRRAAPRW